MRKAHQPPLLTGLLGAFAALGCLRPPPLNTSNAVSVSPPSATAPALETMTEVDAWAAVPLMTPGINIGNTLDNTTTWETGWGNPPITKEFVESLAHLGFKTVRLPVAWDTYANDGRIQPDKLGRVQRGRRLDHRRRHVLRPQHSLGRGLDRFGREGEVPQRRSPHSAPTRRRSTVRTGSRSRLSSRARTRSSSSRRSTKRRTSATKARPEGVRDAHPREPAVHRHRAQDRRQQRQAAADRRRVQHRHRRRPAPRHTSCRRTPSPAGSSSRCTTTRRGSSAA